MMYSLLYFYTSAVLTNDRGTGFFKILYFFKFVFFYRFFAIYFHAFGPTLADL